MNEIQNFKRFPAIRCWIKHLLNGTFSNKSKSLYTIFGAVKRVRIVSTIVDKREIIINSIENEDILLNEENNNIRLEFDLDDGTGLIRAILWRVDPEKYSEFNKGDIVDVVGLIRQWKDYTSISPEIIKKIYDPNFILLRNAEIIKKIKSGDIQEIPDQSEEFLNINGTSGDINIEDLFEEEENGEENRIKEKIYSLIEQHTSEGNGISFEEIIKAINISTETLKNYIKDLEMESRIYPSEKDVYQSY
ncbi:MAG: hypothetical protein ACTSQJ_03005 [Promethearchaeota archaeon]